MALANLSFACGVSGVISFTTEVTSFPSYLKVLVKYCKPVRLGGGWVNAGGLEPLSMALSVAAVFGSSWV